MIKKIYCRAFQAVMKVGNYFLGYRIPDYEAGEGKINNLTAEIKKEKIKRVLLVTDEGIMKLGLADGFISEAGKAGIALTVFTDFQSNPTDINVENGFEAFKENRCEAIVGFGGGSPIDVAKAVAAKAVHPEKPIEKIAGVLKVHKKIPPLYAIPTTAGTGSETTLASVICVGKEHHKVVIMDPSIFPKHVILDPVLTKDLPPFITATTGLDALCHAVESYVNWTYCTKLEKEFSKKAVKLVYENLYDAYENGNNMKARQNMQMAAFYAGRSFTRGCVGYVHAVGHALSGLYGIPHGLAMSVILPHVMRQYGDSAYKRLSELADVCGMDGKTEKEKALKFIDWIDEMRRNMSIPAGFYCIDEKDIPQIISWADREANPLYPVPVIWEKKDFEKIIDTIRTAK